MMVSNSLIPVAVAIVSFLLVKRSHARARSDGRQFIAEYPFGLKLFAIFAMIAVLYISTDTAINARGAIWIGIPVVLCLLLESFGVAINFDETGFSARSPWRGRRDYKWKDIESMYFDRGMQSWVINTRGGKVRMHQYLRGVGDFLSMAKKTANLSSQG